MMVDALDRAKIGETGDSGLGSYYKKIIILYHMVVGLGYPYAVQYPKTARTAFKVSRFRLALDAYALAIKKSGVTTRTFLK